MRAWWAMLHYRVHETEEVTLWPRTYFLVMILFDLKHYALSWFWVLVSWDAEHVANKPLRGPANLQTLEIRLVPKHRRISIGKTCFSLKINISIHSWTSKQICSIRYTQYVYILFWTSRKLLYLRPRNSTRSPPPKAADFFGRFFHLLYNHFLRVQNEIYTYW